jgi:hypothetical protein
MPGDASHRAFLYWTVGVHNAEVWCNLPGLCRSYYLKPAAGLGPHLKEISIEYKNHRVCRAGRHGGGLAGGGRRSLRQ